MVVVYTALFGGGDCLWSVPPIAVRGAKYVVFTEKPRREVGLWTKTSRTEILQGTGNLSVLSPTWEQRIVRTKLDSIRSARYFKILAHEALPEVEISIWIDANVRMLVPPREALKWLGEKDLAAFKHPDRSCLFREASFCERLGKSSRHELHTQAQAYRRRGMPRNWGLAATGCVIRRHTPEIAALNAAWWREIETHSARDQISFSYVCWRQDLRWEVIPGFVLDTKRFWYIRHEELP